MVKVGQNRIYTPNVTICVVISLPIIPFVNRIYRVGQNHIRYMVLANPSNNRQTYMCANSFTVCMCPLVAILEKIIIIACKEAFDTEWSELLYLEPTCLL